MIFAIFILIFNVLLKLKCFGLKYVLENFRCAPNCTENRITRISQMIHKKEIQEKIQKLLEIVIFD